MSGDTNVWRIGTSLDPEEVLLGQIVLDGHDGLRHVIDEIQADDFGDPARARAWDVLVDLSARGEPLGLESLVPALVGAGAGREGCATQVIGWADQARPGASQGAYRRLAAMVRDAAARRRVISLCQGLAELGHQRIEVRGAELLDRLQAGMLDIEAQAQSRERGSTSDVLRDAVDARLSGEAPGLPTGWRDLDDALGGLRPGGLYVVAGRPGMGKTSFAVQIAAHLVGDGRHVAHVTLEVARRDCLLHFAGITAGVPLRGDLTDEQIRDLRRAADDIAASTLDVADLTGEPTLAKIAVMTRLAHARGELDALVVDYLQLMTIGGHVESRQQEVSEISRGLKALARDLDIPVIALSQLNRGSEARSDSRPKLADLRESGAIEQDADAVVLLYRPGYHDPQNRSIATEAEVIVAKNRFGPVGTHDFHWDGERQRFTPAARQYLRETFQDHPPSVPTSIWGE